LLDVSKESLSLDTDPKIQSYCFSYIGRHDSHDHLNKWLLGHSGELLPHLVGPILPGRPFTTSEVEADKWDKKPALGDATLPASPSMTKVERRRT
jgi:hypothetical protein